MPGTASKVHGWPAAASLQVERPAITRPDHEPTVGVGPVKVIGCSGVPSAKILPPTLTAMKFGVEVSVEPCTVTPGCTTSEAPLSTLTWPRTRYFLPAGRI